MKSLSLRDLAQLAASGDKAAIGQLYGQLERRISGAIHKAVARNDVAAEAALTRFVLDRLVDASFWGKAAGADDVGGYVVVSAWNVATDWMRKNPRELHGDHLVDGAGDEESQNHWGADEPEDESAKDDEARDDEDTPTAADDESEGQREEIDRVPSEDDESESEPVADEEAPAAPPERAERYGLLAAVRSVVSMLEARQRAEVKVSFGVLELEADELEAISLARGASIEAVQAELHALADEVESRRDVAESDATHSYARLSSLHRRLELARTALLHARSDPSAPAPGRRPTTANTIARLTHEQLTVEIEQLGVDLERVASSLSDDGKRAKDPFAGRADRRRIAVLLGAVAADAPAKELDRAGNTVWTRSRRVVEALRRSLESRREP